MSKTDKFQVTEHPHSKGHLLFKVLSRGRVYACASAWEAGEFPHENPKPTPQTVEYTWKHSRHYFLPYDESSQRFTK